MKIYRCTSFYVNDVNGAFRACISWHKSHRDAHRALRDADSGGFVNETNIDPGKEGLLSWLNQHFTGDSGWPAEK